MNPKLKQLAGTAGIAICLLVTSAPASADTIKGMIISHQGDVLVVRADGVDNRVTVTGGTKISAITGVVGAQREHHPPSDLIAGLAVTIDAVPNGNGFDAAKITFKPSELKTAMAIQAGTADVRARARAKQAENEAKQAQTDKRLSEVGQFTEKARVRVYFATGSTAIGAKGAQDLQLFAKQARGVPGYLLRVVGNADTTGNAAANQRLSNQRASVVTAYLLKNCAVPPSKIMGSGGLGDYVPIDDNKTAAGKTANRRVTVFLVVSKASQG